MGMGEERCWVGGAGEVRGQVWGGGYRVTQEGRGEREPARRGQGVSHWVNTGQLR